MIFNRPDTTARVFAAIAKAKPPKLLVVADGPRSDEPGEAEKCEAARAIIDRVDWDCEVLKNYAKENMGCRRRVSSGLDWVFAKVEAAIVLEDDCLPHSTFFRFCAELLERYRDDQRVMMISGDNFQFGKRRTDYSYYFSRFAHIWGWASWRRAWTHYDADLKLWPDIKKGCWLKDFLGNKDRVQYWTDIFDALYDGEIDTWDYQLNLSCWMQNGLNIIPEVNLISNIGFQHDGTHTRGKGRLANMDTQSMEFPLLHPPHLLRNSLADKQVESLFFQKELFSVKILRQISTWMFPGKR